jgi:hypothetical protein
VIGTAVGFAISLALLEQAIGIYSPWLGLLMMCYFLAFAKVAKPVFSFTMPAALEPVRLWERDGTVYRRLQVPAFGRLLRETPLRYLNPNVYIKHRRSSLPEVRRRAEAAEAAHLWAAVLFTPYLGYALLSGRYKVTLIFLLIQVTLNFYPIMHLRMVRGRLDRSLNPISRQQTQPSGIHRDDA